MPAQHVKSQTGRIALVTGANRGLGLETCRRLAQCGFHVLLTSRDRQLGEEATGTLCAEGLDVTHHLLDVTHPEQIARLCVIVGQQYGHLDVLVDNAAVSLDPPESSVLDVPLGVIAQTLETNCYGPLRTMRAFVPLMQANGYGRIVNVSSIGGRMSLMSLDRGRKAAYRLSKAALNAVTRLAAGAVRDWNCKVNALCPGPFRTRLGGPKAGQSVVEVAETVVWLATLPKSGPSGKFFQGRERVDW